MSSSRYNGAEYAVHHHKLRPPPTPLGGALLGRQTPSEPFLELAPHAPWKSVACALDVKESTNLDRTNEAFVHVTFGGKFSIERATNKPPPTAKMLRRIGTYLLPAPSVSVTIQAAPNVPGQSSLRRLKTSH